MAAGKQKTVGEDTDCVVRDISMSTVQKYDRPIRAVSNLVFMNPHLKPTGPNLVSGGFSKGGVGPSEMSTDHVVIVARNAARRELMAKQAQEIQERRDVLAKDAARKKKERERARILEDRRINYYFDEQQQSAMPRAVMLALIQGCRQGIRHAILVRMDKGEDWTSDKVNYAKKHGVVAAHRRWAEKKPHSSVSTQRAAEKKNGN